MSYVASDLRNMFWCWQQVRRIRKNDNFKFLSVTFLTCDNCSKALNYFKVIVQKQDEGLWTFVVFRKFDSVGYS